MLYRCKSCGAEVAYGCLPTASCGCYLILLLALSTACLFACLLGADLGLRAHLGLPLQPQGPPPWWFWLIWMPVSFAVGVTLAVLGMGVLKRTFELLEYLAICCRSCPRCGGRRWSWGFTRGYGL